jgi:integral membrane sensor domain MASE1
MRADATEQLPSPAMKCHRLLTRVAFGFGYVALAAISVRQRDALTPSSLFWPPAGLLMAVLMLNPARRWIEWVALTAVLHMAVSMLAGQRSASVAAVFTLTDIAFCTAVAALWRWRTHQSNTLKTLPAALWFVVLLAMGSIAGGLLVAAGLHAVEPAASAAHWYVWSLAAFVGCMITTPLILAWSRFRLRALADQNVLNLWVGLVAAFALLAGTTIVFNDPPRTTLHSVWHDGFGMSYGPLLFLAIVALSWGAAGSTLIVAGLALIAGSYTMSGMGPYANIAHFRGEPLLAVQGYLGCASLLSLITTALAVDRNKALQRAAALTVQLEAALSVNGQVAWEFRRADGHLHWLGRLPYGIAASPAPMPLDRWLAQLHPDDRDRMRAWLHTGADSYAQRRLRVRVQSPDGAFHAVEMTGSALAGAPDRMTGLLGAPRDEMAI